MVDVDDRQSHGLAIGLGLLAEARQALVEGLAVGQAGQAVRHGVATDLVQVLAQTAEFGRGLGELGLQGLAFGLHLLGRGGQVFDDRFHLLLVGQAFGRGGQLLAIFFRRPLNVLDGAGDRAQLGRQHVAGLEDAAVQLGVGQELSREAFAHRLGERFTGRQQAVDLLGEGTVRLDDVLQPQLVVANSRPHLVGFHRLEGPARQVVGLRGAQRGLDVRGHAGSIPGQGRRPTRAA